MRGASVGAALPPLLLGAAIAIAGMTGSGLLLQDGVGVLRAAASILAVALCALAAGGWMSAETLADEVGDALRRGWVVALMVLGVAAALSAVWQLRGLPAFTFTPAITLVLLVALPQLILGRLAGLVGRGEAGAPPLLLGAGVGVFATGHLLIPGLPPAAVYLLTMGLVLGSAMVHSALPPEGGLP